jgi:hypothetical protein
MHSERKRQQKKRKKALSKKKNSNKHALQNMQRDNPVKEKKLRRATGEKRR